MIDSGDLNILTACVSADVYTDEILGPLLQYKKAGADGLMGAMPANEQGDGPLQYSEKLSPAVNHFLAEASRQDVRVCSASGSQIVAHPPWNHLFSPTLLPNYLRKIL